MIPFIALPYIFGALSVALALSYNFKVKILEWNPPTPFDSRGACPALNILCNHGVLPRSGKGIDKKSLKKAISGVFNISKPVSLLLVEKTFQMFGNPKTLDLEMISKHNIIEHDVSLTREDDSENMDALTVKPYLVEEMVKFSKSTTYLNLDDIINFRKIRMEALKESGKEVVFGAKARLFSSFETVLLSKVLQGSTKNLPIEDLKKLFILEKLPNDWQRVNYPAGFVTLGPSFIKSYSRT